MRCRACKQAPVIYETWGQPLCGDCGGAYVTYLLSSEADKYQEKFMEEQIFRGWLRSQIDAHERARRVEIMFRKEAP